MLINPLMTFSLLHCFYFSTWKCQGLFSAAVGLGSLAWPSGHCARRFVWKTCMSLSILVHYYMCPCHYILWSIYQTWSCVTISKQLHDFEHGHESNRPTKKNMWPSFSHVLGRYNLVACWFFLALCFHFTITFFIVELQKINILQKKCSYMYI